MSNEQTTDRPLPPDEGTTPFEAIPMLAADEDFITKADRLRTLKQLHDQHFAESKKGAKDSEFDLLKLEIAARSLVAGVKSISYLDLRVSTTDGGTIKGEVNGALLAELIANLPATVLLRVIAAAKGFDVQKLVDAGVSPMNVAQSKDPDQSRAGSIRVEWIGAKGKGAKERRGGGALQ